VSVAMLGCWFGGKNLNGGLMVMLFELSGLLSSDSRFGYDQNNNPIIMTTIELHLSPLQYASLTTKATRGVVKITIKAEDDNDTEET
jgi:hypothetical protein